MKAREEVDLIAKSELESVINRRRNGCPNDTDGDGNCHLCSRDPGFHWRVTLRRLAEEI